MGAVAIFIINRSQTSSAGRRLVRLPPTLPRPFLHRNRTFLGQSVPRRTRDVVRTLEAPREAADTSGTRPGRPPETLCRRTRWS